MCRAALNQLSIILLWLSGAAFAIMAIHIVCDVVGRYLFQSPLPGTVEIVARYYMVVLVFLPLAYVQLQDKHFVAGIFTDGLPEQALLRLKGVTDFVMALVGGYLTWTAISAALHATHSGEQVQMAEFLLPTWPGRWLVPIGLGLMTMIAVLTTIEKLIGAGDIQDSNLDGPVK